MLFLLYRLTYRLYEPCVREPHLSHPRKWPVLIGIALSRGSEMVLRTLKRYYSRDRIMISCQPRVLVISSVEVFPYSYLIQPIFQVCDLIIRYPGPHGHSVGQYDFIAFGILYIFRIEFHYHAEERPSF